MGGGKGGGGASIPREVEQSAQQLLDIGEQQFDLGFPLLQAGAEQAGTVLGGGVGTLEPAIRSQLEQARSAGSQSLTNLRENLTRQGLTGTALQEALANQAFATEAAIADVPNQFLRPTLEAVAGQSLGLVPQGLQGISAAGSAGASAAIPGRQSGGIAGALGGGASGALAGSQLAGLIPGIGPIGGAIGGGLLGLGKGGK